VTCPQVPWTLAARGPVVISRVTHFPARLGVVLGGPYFVGVLVSKSGDKSLFKSMNSLIHTLLHASPFDFHKSNLHFPCSVPGKNLIVTTKRRLEYPEHINVLVQTVPQEDGKKVGLRVDKQAQLWPETSQCNFSSEHTGPVKRKVQQGETWKFEPTSLEATGCAYSTDLNVGTPWLDFSTAVSQYAGKAVGSTHRLWVRLQAAGQDQGNRPWDLEEGGGLGREPQPGSVETSDITSPLSYITAHLSTYLTNPATIPRFPSPESSNEHTCFLSHHTSKICEPQHMIALRMRRKKAKAGTLLSITRDLSRPPCDFIHCSCAQCQIFRQDSETWQPGSCRAVVGCVPSAGCTMIQRVIGTLNGRLMLNCTAIWLVSMCQKSVTHSSQHPSAVGHSLSQLVQQIDLRGIANWNGIDSVEQRKRCHEPL